MSELLAISSDMDVSPMITLPGVAHPAHDPSRVDHPYGWGFAWYPGDEPAGVLIKDPTTAGDNAMTAVLRDWERFRSTVFLCHLRGAAQRVTQRDTQPFMKTFTGRNWIFAHNGDLHGDLRSLLPLDDDPSLEPIGRTDSERVFSWTLARVRAAGARTLSEFGGERLHALFSELNELGTANFLITDGLDVAAYRDRGGFNALHWVRRVPPHSGARLGSSEVVLEFDPVLDAAPTMVLFSTRPLSGESWEPMESGRLLVARRGGVVYDSRQSERELLEARHQSQQQQQVSVEAVQLPPRARPDEGRVLHVRHLTRYRYEAPVEQSAHTLRLTPVIDDGQLLLSHEISISVDGLRRQYHDVFGNTTIGLDVTIPFTEMEIESRSTVRVAPVPSLRNRTVFRRTQIPLVWMPWQRQMMSPYLLPTELPESELRELSEYAMGFVERNEYDLVETLLDINETIYRDYTYVSGSTTIETTPYQVYESRRGVCQDFANLLICLARLLNVPARYRVGYIWTGANYENRIQSEASHAWAELYLPWVGWRGLDPTNGCMAGRDHVRVACGRNYRDATPTAGTIYKGGGGESLTVDVRVDAQEEAG